MPYNRALLNPGEEISLDLRPHWWYFSKHILTGIPLFVVFFLIFELNGTPENVARVIWAVLAVAWVAWLGVKYLEWRFTNFVVTNRRVIYRTGVFAKHGVEIPLERVMNINFDQGIWERIIGAGDLIIESAGKEGQSDFENVRHPDGVQQEIYREMESNAMRQAQWAQPPAAAPAPSQSVADQIRELARLRDAGHITSQEFEAKKAELLSRM